MKCFIEFLKKEKFLYFLLFLFTILIYFYYFNYIVSIDTEIFLVNKDLFIYSWLDINRFSLVLIKILNIPFNILVTRIVTIVLFFIFVMIFGYIIVKWCNLKKYRFVLLLSSMVILASGIFAEQFVFTLQSFEISLGLLIFLFDFILIDKYISNNNKILLLPIILLTTLCFGFYQSFVIMFFAFAIFYVMTHSFSSIKKIILIFIVSFILYFGIGYLLKLIINVKSGDYLTKNFKLKDYSLFGYILLLLKLGIKNLIANNYYYSIGYLIILLIGMIMFIKKKKYKELILYILMSIVPFGLLICTGSNTAYRAQFSYVFVYIFMAIYLYKRFKLKKILLFFMILFVLKESFYTFNLLKSDYYRYRKDLYIVNDVSKYIKSNDTCVVFLGKVDNNIKIKGETLGRSFAEWDYGTDLDTNSRMRTFFESNGIKYKSVTLDEYNKIKVNYVNSKKITIYDNYVIVNLNKYSM